MIYELNFVEPAGIPPAPDVGLKQRVPRMVCSAGHVSAWSVSLPHFRGKEAPAALMMQIEAANRKFEEAFSSSYFATLIDNLDLVDDFEANASLSGPEFRELVMKLRPLLTPTSVELIRPAARLGPAVFSSAISMPADWIWDCSGMMVSKVVAK
ncbi:MAG: hypothetical protein JNJ45_11850 [Chthonomonas sp.]|nr:hypothetical protein [Chthonomonas sp.]